MEYLGEKIEFSEAQSLVLESPDDDMNFCVSRRGGMVFAAVSRHGMAFAKTPAQALEDAKALIDANLESSDR